MTLVSHRVFVSAFALSLATGGLTACAQAQPAAKPAEFAPVVDALANDAASLAAKERLAKVREAIKAVRSLSYTAHVEDLKTSSVIATGSISATRADAGGWKVYAAGENTNTKGEKTSFTLGYDGLSARALRERDKVVIERSLEKMDELQIFFTGQSVRHPLAWEVLADDPLATTGAVTLEAAANVQGKPCDVLRLAMPAGASEDDKPADGVATATGATAALRVFVSNDDNLPRRIERINLAADGTMVAGRALELRDLATNANATLQQFTLDVPDGWRVRAGDREARRAAREAEKTAAPMPEGVTWRSDPSVLTPGTAAPDFSLATHDGKKKTLADYKGKVIVMDFWATWCGPCKTAMPALQRLHEKYKDQPVAIVGMNAEGGGEGDPVAFKKENGYTYELLLEADAVSETYKVRGLPTFYVVGPDGNIVWGGVGLSAPPGSPRASNKARAEYLEDQLDKLIQSVLPK